MSEDRTDATVEMATDLEWLARELASALEAVIASDGAQARNAERHLMRLRFSLARVDELKQRVARMGGVFEPARLHVAVSILDAHVVRAEGFCEQVAARLPKAARRVAQDVVTDVPAAPVDKAQERAA